MNGIGGLQFKTTGLVFDGAHQPGLTEPSATALVDYSPYGNDGSMTDGEPDWVQLSSGLWTMDFNGGDAVVIPADGSLNNLAEYTYIIWGRPNGAFGSGSPRLFDKTGDAVTGSFSFVSVTYKLRINRAYAGTNMQSITTAAMTADVWKMFVGTLTAADNKGRLYINDAEATAYDQQTAGVGALTDDSSHDLYIGNSIGLVSNFEGMYALPRVLNYALSEAAIGKIFTAERAWFGV